MEKYVIPGLKEAVTLAVNNNNWTLVRTLLEASIDKDSVEYTELQQIPVDYNIIKEAYSRGYTELVSIFLSNGFPVNCIVDTLTTRRMLHLAAENGHLALVKLLINSGADIDCKTYDDKTPLFLAAERMHLEVVKYLISAGVDINTCDLDDFINKCSRIGMHSVTKELYKLLLDSGYHITTKAIISLCWAVRFDNIKFVKVFLDAGADVNGMDTDAGADVNGIDIPLHVAAFNGNIPIMELLLEYGANINSRDRYRRTALHVAVENDKLQSAKFLIESGCLINSVDNCNKSPLSLSIMLRRFDIAMLLLNSGCDIQSGFSYSLLHRAICEFAPIQLIECLLERGDNIGTTALQYVMNDCTITCDWINNWNLSVTKLLLIYGSNHYVEDDYGNTILHWACGMGDLELVEYLIHYGLNVDAKNREGKKPYDIATEKGHNNIVKAIILYHCNKYTSFH